MVTGVISWGGFGARCEREQRNPGYRCYHALAGKGGGRLPILRIFCQAFLREVVITATPSETSNCLPGANDSTHGRHV